jgi:hypothetical protein
VAWPFLCPGTGDEEEPVVNFHQQVALRHSAAVRAGWNDAAWGQPRREVEIAAAPAYERGYAGGLAFRREQQHTTVPDATSVLSQAVPAG